MPGKALPVACTLTPDELNVRGESQVAGLVAQALDCEREASGYRMTFAPSGAIPSTIAAVIDAERQCCRFLQFDLSVTPDAGPVALSISGPAGTAEFLASLINP